MIHREAGIFVAECDVCGETIDVEVDEFYLVPETLKQEGWIIIREKDGSWTHKCPACVAEERNSQNDFEV